MEKQPELLGFIIWHRGKKKLSELLYHIGLKFKIVYFNYYSYPDEQFLDFLLEFYSRQKKERIFKKSGVVRGNDFLYVLALDDSPEYENGVNQNGYRLKRGIRKRDRVNDLHISDTEEDAKREFKIVTGNGEDAFYCYKNSDSNIRLIPAFNPRHPLDVETYDFQPFASVDDVLARLNRYCPWTMLRNWEGFPDALCVDGHDDVDILVKDYYKTLVILDAVPVFEEGYRVQCHVKVNQTNVPFDIRYVGDNYYDPVWEQYLLDNRILHRNFYKVNDYDYFYLLLYHCLVHKRKIKENYAVRFRELGNRLPVFNSAILNSKRKLKKLLFAYMHENGFSFTAPLDLSVGYNLTKVHRWIRKHDQKYRIIKNIRKYGTGFQRLIVDAVLSLI